jgi:MerR family transcriptional regulator, light-induced transcriptional regulator
MDPVSHYIELALRGDLDGLATLVEEVTDRAGPLAHYDLLIRPALAEVGDRWERGLLTVGEEHLITALSEQLAAGLSRRASARSDNVAVIACTPGNQHRVGLLAVAEALALAGWNPLVLGSDTPTQELARMARDRNAGLVALSVGLDAELPTLDEQLRRLRRVVRPDAAILVGGNALFRADWLAPPYVIACDSASQAYAEAWHHLSRTTARA